VATNETPQNFKKDMVNIGRRVMFGGVIGALSGAAFGSVDVVKDVKGMLASRKAAATKVMQYSVRFATFNATYQALQYSLNLYSGLEPEVSFGGTSLRRSSSFFILSSFHPLLKYHAVYASGLQPPLQPPTNHLLLPPSHALETPPVNTSLPPLSICLGNYGAHAVVPQIPLHAALRCVSGSH
jgi:hypothetical protein